MRSDKKDILSNSTWTKYLWQLFIHTSKDRLPNALHTNSSREGKKLCRKRATIQFL